MTIFRYLVLFVLCYNSFGQTKSVENNKFNIELIHSRKLSKIQASTNVILQSDKLKTVYIKLRMSANDESKSYFDINKFSLIEENNKLRIRPISISYQEFTAYRGFNRLSSSPLDFKNIDIRYEPEINDSFKDYEFNGFSVLEIPHNYGGYRKEKLHVSYFKPQSFKTKKLNFFFPFPKDCEKGILYYGKEKIATVQFR